MRTNDNFISENMKKKSIVKIGLYCGLIYSIIMPMLAPILMDLGLLGSLPKDSETINTIFLFTQPLIHYLLPKKLIAASIFNHEFWRGMLWQPNSFLRILSLWGYSISIFASNIIISIGICFLLKKLSAIISSRSLHNKEKGENRKLCNGLSSSFLMKASLAESNLPLVISEDTKREKIEKTQTESENIKKKSIAKIGCYCGVIYSIITLILLPPLIFLGLFGSWLQENETINTIQSFSKPLIHYLLPKNLIAASIFNEEFWNTISMQSAPFMQIIPRYGYFISLFASNIIISIGVCFLLKKLFAIISPIYLSFIKSVSHKK